MNCPKCKAPIADNDLVCSHCKKVIRLQCHVCGAVTKNSVCEKCGTVLLNKCYKCGKLNVTTLDKCPKCKLDINASIGLRESLIEEFAVLTVEITNFDDLKIAFKSDKITNQFKNNLYTMVKKVAFQKKLRVQFVDDTYIIRFCKDYSFIESCKSAIDFSIFVAQTVSEINKKLFDAKGIELKVQMAVQKRDVYSKPEEYKSGLNINVVYSSSGKSHLYNNTEVVVDSYVYQATKTLYPYQSLSAVFVKNQMVMFFELILHKIIKQEEEKKIDINDVKLPKYVDYEPDDDLDDEKLINFDSLNCTFSKIRNGSLLSELEKVYSRIKQNPIISIRSKINYQNLNLLSLDELQSIFVDCNLVRVCCKEDNKYNAYGLFKQMMFAYRGIDELSFLERPEIGAALTSDYHLQELFLMNIKEQVHPEDLRYSYFEAFTNFIESIPTKTIFVIDDFNFVDEGSLEILKYLCENNRLGNIGIVLSSDEQFALHRKIYRLMTMANYHDIELKPTSNKKIVALNHSKIKDIQETFFIEKILENTKGSQFYFDTSLNYLVDDEILIYENGKYSLVQDRMIVIPFEIEELIAKRIKHLQIVENAYELYASLLLCGDIVSLGVVHQFSIKNEIKLLQYLEQHGFVKIVDEKFVLVINYNISRRSFILSCETNKLQELAENVLTKLFVNNRIPNANKALLLEYAKLKKEAFVQWHSLAMISSQSGDFSAYINCTNKFLSLVDNVIDEETDKTVEQVKMDVYSEMATMLYKYYPDKIINFLQSLLTSLEYQNDNQRIKEVANKLVQSCLITGNYNNALEYIGKIISRTEVSSFNPADKNFNLNYFLVNLVTLEIYFNLGRLEECIELGDELFKYIDLSTITESVLPEGFSKKQFEEALVDAMFFVNISRIIQLKDDRRDVLLSFENRTNQRFTFFKLLYLLNEFLEGKDVMAALTKVAQIGLKDKYSQSLFPLLQALTAWRYQDWNNLGNYIYNAKLVSAILNQYQIEYFCDLMIGFAYQNLGNYRKAKEIYYNILDLSEEKSIKNITYLAWVLIAKVEFADHNAEMAVGLINNAIINLEKDENTSVYFALIFKALSAEVMLTLNTNLEKALFCTEQAYELSVKSGLNIYLLQFSDMLLYIYNGICSSDESDEVKQIYFKKADTLKKFMQQKFPNLGQ